MTFLQAFKRADSQIDDMATRLRVSRQSISLWRTSKEFPLFRALQVEKMTGGDVPWEALCPSAAKRLAATPTLS